jgi:hypothetical protein
MVTKHILNDLVEYCGRLRLEVDSHNDEAFKYILEIEILSEKLLKEVKEEEERNENILED